MVRHFRDDIYLAVRLQMWVREQLYRRNPEKFEAVGIGDFAMHIGSLHMFRNDYIKEFDIAEQMTVGNDVITINYCVNYGGRTEIVEATRERRGLRAR